MSFGRALRILTFPTLDPFPFVDVPTSLDPPSFRLHHAGFGLEMPIEMSSFPFAPSVVGRKATTTGVAAVRAGVEEVAEEVGSGSLEG